MDNQFLLKMLEGSDKRQGNADIQGMLGKLKEYYLLMADQRHILCDYAAQFAIAANVTLTYDAANAGFESARVLKTICRDMVDGGIAPQNEQYYMQINPHREKILSIPSRHMQLDLCFISLADKFFENAYLHYLAEQKNKLDDCADLPKLRELYGQVEIVIGEKKAGQVQDILLQYLVDITIMQAFRQGWLNEILYILSDADEPNGTSVLQYWMDNF